MSTPSGDTQTSLDAIDLVFGLVPYGMTFLGITAWTRWLVRALRGEGIKISTGMSLIAGGTIASWSFVSASHVRESVALRDSISELRKVASDEAANEADRYLRDSERDNRVYRLTVAMVVLAALTLLAAITTLASTIA